MKHPSRLHALIGTVGLALAAVLGGCSADEWLDKSDKEARPSGGMDCYQSFDSFKTVMRRNGNGTQGDEHWHHIVEQNPANKKRFPDRLHCTDNLVKIPRPIHEKINGHYSSKQRWTEGKTVREMISA